MTKLPLPEATAHTLDRMIACVAREITMRERVYPKWVAVHKMSQRTADEEIGTMRDVLSWLQEARSNV